MKRKDIQPCLGCGKGVMHDNALVFYRIKVEMFVADLNAIRREAGLEMMMGGNVAIAMALSPNEDLAKQMSEVNGLVCLQCTMDLRLAELTPKKEKSDD